MDKQTKKIGFMIIGILFILVLNAAYTSYKGISIQAKQTGVSANYQWQNAMKWTRENTPEGSVFIHWWDYGYWVQTLGKRPTVTDGGHGVGYWDHIIGRYLLTTPYPKRAYSLMKTHNVSYLLIDPTDLGKYSAYSSIGGGKIDSQDRLAAIPIMSLDARQTRETANGTQLVYTGGTILFEDIKTIYQGKEIFLPARKAGIGGIIIQSTQKNGSLTFQQPEGGFIYNGKQINLPIRFVYLQGQLIDYGSGIEAVIDIIPSSDGKSVNPIGSAIYLSPKVQKGLFAQLYLLNDPLNKYPTIKLAHSQDDAVISSLKNQGYNTIGEFINYRGFRGPIKIWKVEYPKETAIVPGFLNSSGEYGEFDDAEFVR